MTPQEMKANGYSFELSNSPGRELRVRLYQNGEYVAALSPLHHGLGFDWHRADQWHLRGHHVQRFVEQA